MIDFHSHILPCIDDGSSSTSESIELLEMLRAQGVECVFATPHFDASCETPSSFLSKRDEAYSSLMDALGDRKQKLPQVALGAEVMYFSGISGMKELRELRLEGTRLLLLEMPICTWSEYTVRELINLSCSGEIKVLLAHFERYIQFQSIGVIERLLESGVFVQANASFFVSSQTRRRALKMLKHGDIHVLGSDTHNVSYRPPRLGEAIFVIEKKFGEDFVSGFTSFGKSFLSQN